MTAYEDPNVFIFEKSNGEERFLILVNVRNKENTVNIPQDWAVRQIKDEMTNQDITLQDSITLKPYQYLILGQ